MLTKAFGVLALLVLAAILTGVAQSAATTVIPKQLTGSWGRGADPEMVVTPRGNVRIFDFGLYHARFSRVTKRRLSISVETLPGGPLPASCSGTGTYRWTIANHGDVLHEPGHQLKLKKIHDGCKRRVSQFAGIWFGT